MATTIGVQHCGVWPIKSFFFSSVSLFFSFSIKLVIISRLGQDQIAKGWSRCRHCHQRWLPATDWFIWERGSSSSLRTRRAHSSLSLLSLSFSLSSLSTFFFLLGFRARKRKVGFTRLDGRLEVDPNRGFWISPCVTILHDRFHQVNIRHPWISSSMTLSCPPYFSLLVWWSFDYRDLDHLGHWNTIT